jgi:hypothetical protein
VQYLAAAGRLALTISLTAAVSYTVAAEKTVDPFSATAEKTAQPNQVAVDKPANLISNSGAEQGGDGRETPSGWFMASLPAPSLRMFVSDGHSRAGKACLAICNQHEYSSPVANNWGQEIRPIPTGKSVRLSAYVRTDDAKTANVCVQCWTDNGERMVGFASTPLFRGTHGWTLAEADELVVPSETTLMIVRAALTGTGTAYFDDISLQVVEQKASAAPDVAESDLARQVRASLNGRIVHSSSLAKDSMVLAYLPGWNHGNVDNIGVENHDGGVRTLLAWPKLLANDVAQPGRRFVIALYARKTMLRSNPGPVGVYEVLDDWTEATSWQGQPRIAEQPATQSEMMPGVGWKFFDVTPVVRKQDTSQNDRGIMLRFEDESVTGNGGWSSYQLVSREAIGEWTARRPALLVIEPDSPR